MKHGFSALGLLTRELEALSLGYWMNYNQNSSKDDQGRERVSLLVGFCAPWDHPSRGLGPSSLLGMLVALFSLPPPTKHC